jgi:hypothetical protein
VSKVSTSIDLLIPSMPSVMISMHNDEISYVLTPADQSGSKYSSPSASTPMQIVLLFVPSRQAPYDGWNSTFVWAIQQVH